MPAPTPPLSVRFNSDEPKSDTPTRRARNVYQNVFNGHSRHVRAICGVPVGQTFRDVSNGSFIGNGTITPLGTQGGCRTIIWCRFSNGSICANRVIGTPKNTICNDVHPGLLPRRSGAGTRTGGNFFNLPDRDFPRW